MNRYNYEGPVLEFDQCIAHIWRGSTLAPSEKKAKSNLAYQFKRSNNKIPATKITLPGKLVLVEEGDRHGLSAEFA